VKLPDESRTLIVRRDGGEFKGQATYWRRGAKWELIGVFRTLRFLHETAFEDVESEVGARGLKCEWRKSPSFLTRSLLKK